MMLLMETACVSDPLCSLLQSPFFNVIFMFYFFVIKGVYQFELSLGPVGSSLHSETRTQRFNPRARLLPYPSNGELNDWFAYVAKDVAILPGRWTHFGYSYDSNTHMMELYFDGHRIHDEMLCKTNTNCDLVVADVDDDIPIRIG